MHKCMLKNRGFSKYTLLVTIFFGIVLAHGAQAIPATQLTVSTFDDEADVSPSCASGTTIDCSLREAIIVANGGIGNYIITVPAGTYTLNLQGLGEDAAATG